MSPQTDLSTIDESELPGYLQALTDELREEVKRNPGLEPSRTASELAPEQRHLIMNRGDPDNLAVLQALRDLDSLSFDNLEMQRKAAPSYDYEAATIEAIVTSSLETFIHNYLESQLQQQAENTTTEQVA